MYHGKLPSARANAGSIEVGEQTEKMLDKQRRCYVTFKTEVGLCFVLRTLFLRCCVIFERLTGEFGAVRIHEDRSTVNTIRLEGKGGVRVLVWAVSGNSSNGFVVDHLRPMLIQAIGLLCDLSPAVRCVSGTDLLYT